MNSQGCDLLLFYLLPAGLLVTLITGQPTSSSICPPGWFGPGCIYQCHCLVSDSCLVNGDCPNNEKCDPDYFGPACQYREALKWRGSFVDNYLIDDDDATCNPVPNAKSVEVTLVSAIGLTWFRLFVNNNKTLNFTTKVNGNEDCVHQAMYQVDSNTIDVTCDGGVEMHTLEIVGPIAVSICSLYLSGGRNTALRQQVNQTSTDSFSKWSTADKAVDGNTDTYKFNRSCMMTSKSTSAAMWRLSYNRPHHIHSIVIYNGAYSDRLYLISVATLNAKSSQINHYLNNKTGVTFLNVTTEYIYPISEIRVVNGVDYDKRQSILAMCELQAWGDTVCPDRTYGEDCKKCSCKSKELCNVYTGACSHCPDGFFWLNCTSPCSTTCFNDTCFPFDGKCLACKPGYMGDFCTKDCDQGQYGQGCTSACPTKCSPYCDNKDGTCLRCSDGLYADQCTQNCSKFCRHYQCDRYSGACLSCPINRVGSLCAECTDGFYGENCTQICSRFCEPSKCDKNSGYCFSCSGNSAGFQCNNCTDGFYGENCSNICPQFCEHKKCDKNSGECFSCPGSRYGAQCDCNSGFHGDNCTGKNCSHYCRQGKCQTSSGHCSSCLGNRAGFGCDVCVVGFYGEHCTSVCPEFCLHKRCHRQSGNCIYCQPHRAGARCTDCSDGFYGLSCTKVCPRFCLQRKCGRQSGDCFSCLGKRSGIHCTECDAHMYGLQCEYTCSRFCINGTCDQVTGKCTKCSLPDTAALCLSVPEKPALWAAPLTLFPFLLLIFFFLPNCPEEESDSNSSIWDTDGKSHSVDPDEYEEWDPEDIPETFEAILVSYFFRPTSKPELNLEVGVYDEKYGTAV